MQAFICILFNAQSKNLLSTDHWHIPPPDPEYKPPTGVLSSFTNLKQQLVGNNGLISLCSRSLIIICDEKLAEFRISNPRVGIYNQTRINF